MLVFSAFAVLAALVLLSQPSRDPVRLRARCTGTLVEKDYVAHALAVRRRHVAIRHQRREFDRQMRAHLERCEVKWRESGWRPVQEKWKPLAFRPALGGIVIYRKA